jgi:lysophospholipase L1-like esterase
MTNFHSASFPSANRTNRWLRRASLAITVALVAGLAGCAKHNAPLDPANFSGPVKVACVGDSITQGAGASPGKSYPDQLQALLGDKWVVKNYGVGGRTLLRKGDAPWWNETAYQNAHQLTPDAVVIMLGTNDTKPQNWVHKDDFYGDYKDLIESFKALPNKPHIWIVRPTPVPGAGNYGINEANLDVLLPIIDKLATDEDVGEIDAHAAFDGHADMFPDRVHPNDAGAGLLAHTVAHAIAIGQ